MPHMHCTFLRILLLLLTIPGISHATPPSNETASQGSPASQELQPATPALMVSDPSYTIDLITIGPGDHLFTRGGHAALLVTETQPDGTTENKVYNYGATDWNQSMLPVKFLTGSLKFHLETTGDLLHLQATYGTLADRALYTQRLHLSDKQAQWVAAHLKESLSEEKRQYDYHHVEQICTTKIRDLLDDLLGGEIQKQLGEIPDTQTVRTYQNEAFEGHFWPSLGADLFFGRKHDQPISAYYALFSPDRMRENLTRVQVPSTDNPETLVPLAGPVKVIRSRLRPGPITGKNEAGWRVFFFIALIMAGATLFGIKRLRRKQRPDAYIVPLASMSAIVGCLLWLLLLGSTVPELRFNEWLLLFCPLDILIVWGCLYTRTGSQKMLPKWVIYYSWVRFFVALITVVFRLSGTLIQEPVLLFWLAIWGICSSHLFLIFSGSSRTTS